MAIDETNGTVYKKTDDIHSYIKQLISSGAPIITAEKFARTAARQGVPGEKITTWSSDANGAPIVEKETTVSADPISGAPDWVVTKLDGDLKQVTDANGHINEWVINDTTFRKKYEEVENAAGIFKPVGGPQKFIKLNEAISILQWGQIWNVDAGGYINITSENDIYVISAGDFDDTYSITD